MAHADNERFAHLIKDARRNKGLTVYDLATKLDKTPGYISKIEVRGEIPSPELILGLAEILDIDPERLMDVAKKHKIKELSTNVERKFDDAIALFRKERRK